MSEIVVVFNGVFFQVLWLW